MIDHLTPSLWAAANRMLVRKALAEFAHERLLDPVAEGDRYVVGDYSFRATRLHLDHWEIDPDSITRAGGAVDAVDFILAFRAEHEGPPPSEPAEARPTEEEPAEVV